METELGLFIALLSIFWFLAYWVLGGVFFALVAIARLGRVRKVRFSCLFTLLSLILAVGASWIGIRLSDESIQQCADKAMNKAEMVTAIFGCGFAGVLGVFLLGAAVLVLGGFLIMAISKPKDKPWFNLDGESEDEEGETEEEGQFFKK